MPQGAKELVCNATKPPDDDSAAITRSLGQAFSCPNTSHIVTYALSEGCSPKMGGCPRPRRSSGDRPGHPFGALTHPLRTPGRAGKIKAATWPL